jgi:phenylacetic acid degradation operon negative regulatory protein
MVKYFYSATKQKAVLLLAAGVALGLSRSPQKHMELWKKLPKAWKEIDRTVLRRIITEFKYKRLVDFKTHTDGTATVVLTKLGRQHAVRYNPDLISIKIPSRWDRKWRIVIFDIPEKKKQARETFRRELRKLGFSELQKSTWILPYECTDAINFLVELFEIRNCVRLLKVVHISHDADLRLRFGLRR